MSVLPLEGIRILNFGTSVIAPMCCRYLSDYGAEVIKIETATRLDRMRFLTPIKEGAPMEETINLGANFLDYNRGAKSVLANFKVPESIELCKKLVAVSDVVVENFSPRVMKKLGLGYDDLKKVKPDIIMASLSAVGQEGPLYDLVTWGPTIASITGMQSMLGYSDGEPAQDYASADFNGAGQAAFLILCALRHKKNTGEGQFIDMGQAAPHVYYLGEALMDFSMNKREVGMQGNKRNGFVPYNMYRCKPDPAYPIPQDMWVSICVETEEDWKNFCKVIGNPAWTVDEKFADRAKRWENQEELDGLINEWSVKYTKYEVMYMMQAAGIASAPFMKETDLMSDPHIKARGVFKPLDLDTVKGVLFAKTAMNLSDSETPWVKPSNLGQDNEYVYGKLCGLSKEEIAKLVEKKAIA